ncbi:hypothetical protein BB561_003398 [Smittium simulii]|uniref:Uncharacterized protein n=1 Tax=Smittium simulii TaxID=133385 RepID=A0A2T9YLL1_9FUNG|nr:hypothetical protein BB561_003398 [Smittium simulii]
MTEKPTISPASCDKLECTLRVVLPKIITWGLSKRNSEFGHRVDRSDYMACKQAPSHSPAHGNPGLINFYTEFLSALHEKNKELLEIVGVSHLGHSLFEAETGCLKVPEKVYTLQDQISHISSVFDYVYSMYSTDINRHNAPKFIMCGHSVGAYITEKVFAQKHKLIDQVYYLFPTVTHIRETPNGKKLTMLFQPVTIFIVGWFAAFLRIVVPINLVARVINLYQKDLPLEQTTNNCLEMAREEMQSIQGLDADLYMKHGSKFIMYYGTTDGWVPLKHYDSMVALDCKGKKQQGNGRDSWRVALRAEIVVDERRRKELWMELNNKTSNNNREFVLEALKSGYRIDGRGIYDYRNLEIKCGEEAGSVQVQLGDSRVIAKTTIEVVKPAPERPSEGKFSVGVDFRIGTTQAEESGGKGSGREVALSRLLEKLVQHNRVVDTESLCISVGERVFKVRTEVVFLNYGGNYADAGVVAVITSLKHFKRPEVTRNGHEVIVHDLKTRAPVPLCLNQTPVCVTFSYFASAESKDKDPLVVLDPNFLEEKFESGCISIGVNTSSNSELCLISKLGGFAVSSEIINLCSIIAVEKSLLLADAIRAALTASA